MRIAQGFRRHRLLIGLTVLVAAVAFPLGAFASHQFTDVPDSSSYHDDIAAIKNAGVTSGCSATKYCPKDYVTREQMAAFMNRLGALEADKTPVVNATKVDGKDANDIVRVAYDYDDDSALAGVSGTALSTSITAPSAGFLVIEGSSDLFNYSTTDSVNCLVSVDDVNVTMSVRSMVLNAGNPEEDCSTNAVWVVLSGSHTVKLLGTGVDASTTFDESALSVIFVPFGSAGGGPILVSGEPKNSKGAMSDNK